VKNANLNLYRQLPLIENGDAMKKRVPKTLSIDPDTLAHGLERAAQFKLTFSRHVERLIEEDYQSRKARITIVAEPSEPPGLVGQDTH
jgi:hypothetical protein